MSEKDRRSGLPRETTRAVDLVPSLRDLLPTFPFLRRPGTIDRVIPETNLLLSRLNASIDDLANATDVLLIGTNDLTTPITADLARGMRSLRFGCANTGDGRVIYNRIEGLNVDAGLAFSPPPVIETIPRSGIGHDALPKDTGVIDLVLREFLAS